MSEAQYPLGRRYSVDGGMEPASSFASVCPR